MFVTRKKSPEVMLSVAEIPTDGKLLSTPKRVEVPTKNGLSNVMSLAAALLLPSTLLAEPCSDLLWKVAV